MNLGDSKLRTLASSMDALFNVLEQLDIIDDSIVPYVTYSENATIYVNRMAEIIKIYHHSYEDDSATTEQESS